MSFEKKVDEIAALAEAGDMEKLGHLLGRNDFQEKKLGLKAQEYAAGHIIVDGTPEALRRLLSFPQWTDGKKTDLFMVAIRINRPDMAEVFLESDPGLARRTKALLEKEALKKGHEGNPMRALLLKYEAKADKAPPTPGI